jgi:hypothetical protein
MLSRRNLVTSAAALPALMAENITPTIMPVATTRRNKVSNTATVLLNVTRSLIPSVPLPSNTIMLSGYAAAGDYGAGAIYTSVGAGPSGPMAIQDLSGTWWNLLLTPELNIGWFGAVGDGTTDDTTAVGHFLDNVNGHTGILTGTYKLTFLLSKALTNVRLIGIPGQTTITGSFDYAVLHFLALNNVLFEGIKFTTTYSNVFIENTKAAVYSIQSDVKNVKFSFCEFTAPNANCQGMRLMPRIDVSDTSAVIQGLWIEDCYFHDTGDFGCTVMNRGVNASDKYTAGQHIYFNRNRSANIGTISGVGILFSLDGVGSNFETNYNSCNGCSFEGIENTGYINGTIIGNSSTDGSMVFAIDGSQTGIDNRVMTGLTVIGNVMYGANPGTAVTANLSFLTNSYFAGNIYLIGGTAQQCMVMRGMQNCVFVGEQYICTSTVSLFDVLIQTPSSGTPSKSLPCFNNSFKACIFDSQVSAGQNQAVAVSGSGTTNNVFDGTCIFKFTSGIAFTQGLSANNNWVDGLATAFTPTLIGASGTNNHTYLVHAGFWSRAGNKVSVSGIVALSIKDSGMSGSVSVRGLPWPAVNDPGYSSFGTIFCAAVTMPANTSGFIGEIDTTLSQIDLYAQDSTGAGGFAHVDSSNMANGSIVKFSTEYNVDPVAV